MIVVDASAMGALLLQDHETGFIVAVEDALASSTIHAPVHWPVEIMNLLVKSERQGRTPVAELPALWRRAEKLVRTATVEPVKVDGELLDLALNSGLTPRDAAYFEMATRLGCTLCTADNAMIRVSKALSVPLLAPQL
jgi:predicted nucleic acid-binding protein